jgi:cytochrome c biogenesis protein CcmG/thiol:disulfide interchange protein DsbE
MRATFAVLGACTLLLIPVLSGCGSDESAADAPTPAEARRALAGSPPRLAALHRQAAALLDGGLRAYEARVAALRGRPIVVNAWASWCDPCEREMPVFQRAAVRLGRRVAFLGVNVRDGRATAEEFLREHWIPYPSYEDPDERIARDIGARVGLPTTVFYDREGDVAFVHQGPYRDEQELADDVERYATGTS